MACRDRPHACEARISVSMARKTLGDIEPGTAISIHRHPDGGIFSSAFDEARLTTDPRVP